MSRKKATSSDVAKRAGVSQATVSMVLNKKYNVSFSREVIRKVEEAAAELGYELPRRKARKEGRKEKLLVVLCPNLTNPYYVMLLQGIESRATEQGYGLFVCNTQRNLELEERYLKMLPSLNPQGVVYTCNPSRCYMPMVEELSRKIPPGCGLYRAAPDCAPEAALQAGGRISEGISGSGAGGPCGDQGGQ